MSFRFRKYSPAEMKFQEKNITENGTYTPDEGYDGMSKVNVQVGGVNPLQRLLELNNNSASYFFYGSNATSLDDIIPLVDFSNSESMSYMFAQCQQLTSIPLFDTSNCTSMYYMFEACTRLQTLPLLNTSKVGSMTYTFSNCSKLVTIPLFDTKNVGNMAGMFYNCGWLEIIPALDLRNITTIWSFVERCNYLKECWVRNIKVNFQVGSGTTYGHRLTLESLLSLCKECHNVGSARTLTIGSANLEKLANVYVKLVSITDAMRAEDDLIDSKSPFEVCESTDEGAMTIQDYMTTKMWQLA